MITVAEFKKRRKQLQMSLPNDAIAIIPGASEQIRNHDVHYPFRQNSDFLYLTGFSEADAVLLITGGDEGQSILFCQPFSLEKEIYYRMKNDGEKPSRIIEKLLKEYYGNKNL